MASLCGEITSRFLFDSEQAIREWYAPYFDKRFVVLETAVLDGEI